MSVTESSVKWDRPGQVFPHRDGGAAPESSFSPRELCGKSNRKALARQQYLHTYNSQISVRILGSVDQCAEHIPAFSGLEAEMWNNV